MTQHNGMSDAEREGQFLWCLSTVLQRTFEWDEEMTVLIPVLDMINHKTLAGNTHYFTKHLAPGKLGELRAMGTDPESLGIREFEVRFVCFDPQHGSLPFFIFLSLSSSLSPSLPPPLCVCVCVCVCVLYRFSSPRPLSSPIM